MQLTSEHRLLSTPVGINHTPHYKHSFWLSLQRDKRLLKVKRLDLDACRGKARKAQEGEKLQAVSLNCVIVLS